MLISRFPRVFRGRSVYVAGSLSDIGIVSDMNDSLRGHPIYRDGNEWRFSDTGEPTAPNWKNRPCGICLEFPTKDGHDACIGKLANVSNACCGHGDLKSAYIQYDDGVAIEGESAIRAMGKRNA